jgi:hypothetical protein
MLKTYTREELKQLEGKRVRISIISEDYTVQYTGIFSITWDYIYLWGSIVSWKITHSNGNQKIELLENEFEVGEKVEVSDFDNGEREPDRFCCAFPWGRSDKYYMFCTEHDYEKYKRWEDYEVTNYSYIRKIHPKPEPKKMTMEELNKELWYDVEIVEKK